MHVYFSGIGGVGIGPLAMLALDCGYEVSGSDLKNTEMTALLEVRGANIHIGQDESEIARVHEDSAIDWFVHSSALPLDHPELTFIDKHKIKRSKRSEFLNHIMRENDLKLVAVSGTHGKTTTTGMLVWLFKKLDIPVSYSIGTSISFGPPAQHQPGSQYFIYECDEFDRNFLDFKPHLSIFPSVDYDHPDTYPTQDDYIDAFKQFTKQSEHNILWNQAFQYLELAEDESITVLGEQSGGQSVITLPGEHVRKNAWLAVQAMGMIAPGALTESVIAQINRFPGTNRRFEKLDENVYTDYAHHPIEIAATIELARELNPKVVVVYQPHQNIRQHEIMSEGGYKNCFEDARKVYWLPTYLSREYQDLDTLEPDELIASTTNSTAIQITELNQSLLEKLKQHQLEGDLIVGMSAGNLDDWLRAGF